MPPKRRRLVAVIAAVAILAAGTATGILLTRGGGQQPVPIVPGCRVGSGPHALALTLDQAESATSIAAVAERMHLPAHALVVALATALQESKLRDLPFGDRDSVGLFQQRPSQGWGTPRQLLRPAFAAQAFFRHLVAVPGWERLPVAVAAQDVQHSADGSAYAQWEEVATAMARVVSGRLPTQLGCEFAVPASYDVAGLRRLADRELGPGVLGRPPPAQRWLVADWLVAHAYGYGVASVSVGHERWTNVDPAWKHTRRRTDGVRFTAIPRPTPTPQSSTG